MNKKILLVSAIFAGTATASHAEPVLVSQEMNFATKQVVAEYFVDFSAIKTDKDPAYRIMAITVKFMQPRDSDDSKKYLAAVLTSKYDCKYGQGYLTFDVKKYSSREMTPGSLVYSTPKPGKNLIIVGSQWMQDSTINPVVVGHPNRGFQDMACGRLQRSDFE